MNMIEILKSKDIFQVISNSLKYLVTKDNTESFTVQDLLKQTESLLEVNY